MNLNFLKIKLHANLENLSSKHFKYTKFLNNNNLFLWKINFSLSIQQKISFLKIFYLKKKN